MTCTVCCRHARNTIIITDFAVSVSIPLQRGIQESLQHSESLMAFIRTRFRDAQGLVFGSLSLFYVVSQSKLKTTGVYILSLCV